MGSEVVKEFWVISKRGLSRVNKLGLNGQQYSAHINFLRKSLSENPEGFGITHKQNKSRICHKYQTVEPLNGWGPSSPEQWARVDGRIYLRSSFSSGRSFITIVILLILHLPFREIV